MKFPTMFSPVQIGSVTVPNRFVVPPMGNNLANTDGSLSDRSLSYYKARAKGGFGLITIESTVVYEQAKGGPRKPCLFSDSTVESFRQVASACHAYGAKVSIQLQHAGPEGSSALTGLPPEGGQRDSGSGRTRNAGGCVKRRALPYHRVLRRRGQTRPASGHRHGRGPLARTAILSARSFPSAPTTARTSLAAALKTGCAFRG